MRTFSDGVPFVHSLKMLVAHAQSSISLSTFALHSGPPTIYVTPPPLSSRARKRTQTHVLSRLSSLVRLRLPLPSPSPYISSFVPFIPPLALVYITGDSRPSAAARPRDIGHQQVFHTRNRFYIHRRFSLDQQNVLLASRLSPPCPVQHSIYVLGLRV